MLGGALGPYHIEAELGSGGMGCVYQARVEGKAPGLDPGTRVALKVIHPHLLESPNTFKRFLLEARLGQRLHHVNVVRTHDCDAVRLEGQDHHFLVMELVRGVTLRSLLDELGTVPEELCRHIGCQIARGLSAIHAAGAVHRDLKPENVLITADQTVKIMDLGVARLLDDPLRLSRTGHFVGSILYAPPEAFRHGGKEVDGRADLHSLGILLHEIATGRHPFRHYDMRIVLRMVLTQEPERVGALNPQLSPFFEELVHKLCSKAPDDRFRDADELLAALEVGEASVWWEGHARTLASRTRRPLRRIRVPRETALHGRGVELGRLRELYDRACAGEGQVLLLEGEAGVGKSRLVDEFVAGLQQAGEDVNFLYGSYPPGGAATAAGAFSTAFREHFGAIGLEATLQDYLFASPSLIPAFAALLRGESPPAGQEALTKDSLHTVFIHATQGLAEDRPTIVAIDDLHFAPPEGRALFAALALAVPGRSVLLIGSMRPGVTQAWSAEVERHEHTQRISLARLGPKDLAGLLEEAFKSQRLAARLGHEIARSSDGNPFFVFEIVRSLRDAGQIRLTSDGSWITTDVEPTIRVPSSVVEMVHARLAALEEEDAELLHVAACMGHRFDPLLLVSVLDLSELAVLRRLGRIERIHGLVRSTGRLCTFDHCQVQEVLYSGLSELIRERYHGRIADVLSTRIDLAHLATDGSDGRACVDLARHAVAGARPALARPSLGPALKHLEEGQLNDAAITLARDALGYPKLLEGDVRCETLLHQIYRLHLAGRRDEERAALDEALELAQGTRFEARVRQARGELAYALAQFQEAIAHYEQARDCARASGDQRTEAAARGRLGGAYSSLSRHAEARPQFEASIALAKAIGDFTLEAGVTGNLGLSYVAVGEYARARKLLERHLAVARRSRNRQSEAVALGNLGLVCADQGDTEQARRHFRDKLAIAREIGDRLGQAVATANLGMTLHSLGRFEEARAAYSVCMETAREIGAREGEANAAGNLGMIYYSLGRFAQAMESYRRSIQIAQEIGDRYTEGDQLSNLGTIEVVLGRLDQARETLERGLAIVRDIGATRPEGYAFHGLARLAEERAERETAHTLHTQALKLWTKMGAKEALAQTRLALGKLALQERADLAVEHFDHALRLATDTCVPDTLLLATVHRAALPDGDLATALAALERYEGRVGAEEWMEAQMVLFRMTGDLSYLQEARHVLEGILEHAPAGDRSAMRERVALHRQVLAAAATAASSEAR